MGLAFRALAFSVVLGLCLTSVVTWISRGLQAGATAPSLSAPYAITFLVGLLVSLLAAGASCWWLLRPLRNPYRQGMLSIVSVCGGFLLSLATQPVDQLFGRPGLLVLALGAAAASFLLWRRALRARTPA